MRSLDKDAASTDATMPTFTRDKGPYEVCDLTGRADERSGRVKWPDAVPGAAGPWPIYNPES